MFSKVWLQDAFKAWRCLERYLENLEVRSMKHRVQILPLAPKESPLPSFRFSRLLIVHVKGAPCLLHSILTIPLGQQI